MSLRSMIDRGGSLRGTGTTPANPHPVPGKPETYLPQRVKARSPHGRRPSITSAQRGVFHLLKHLGPSTADDLVKYYESGRKFLDRGYRYPAQQPSGIRTRLIELERKGYVERTADRVYQDGSRRSRAVWKAL